MSDRLSTLLSRLNGVRERRNGSWLACCPVHKGGRERTPSLLVKYLPPGQIVVCCAAGCESSEVLTAIGLDLAYLCPAHLVGKPAGAPQPARPMITLRERLDTLTHELHDAWAVLSDVAGGHEIGPTLRARARASRDRLADLLKVRDVRC